jgi:hypothetical protein
MAALPAGHPWCSVIQSDHAELIVSLLAPQRFRRLLG